MKKLVLKSVCLLFTAVAAVSCGGSGAGSSASPNATLGVVPVIYKDIADNHKATGEKMRQADGVEAIEKLRQEEEAYAEDGYAKAAEEGPKAVGNDVEFTGGDVYPDFQITGVKVAEFKQGDGSASFVLRVTAAPKKDMVVWDYEMDCGGGQYSLNDTRMYYVLMRSDDHLIELGTLNPFSSETTVARQAKTEYAAGQTIKAGTPCNSEGAPIYVNCHTYDFSDFAKVLFLSETDYNNLRSQAYGF